MRKYRGGSKIKIKERQQKKSWQLEVSGLQASFCGVPKWVCKYKKGKGGRLLAA